MKNTVPTHLVNLLSEVIKAMPEQAVICDSVGKILFANDSVTKFTGYLKSECLGKKPGELWGFNMAPEFYVEMWHTLKDFKIPFSADIQNVRKDNTVIWQELNIFPILDEQGEVILLLGIEPDLQKYPDESKEFLLQLHELLSDQENHPNPFNTIDIIAKTIQRMKITMSQSVSLQ